MRDAGYTAKQLRDHNENYEINDLMEAGYSLRDLKDA